MENWLHLQYYQQAIKVLVIFDIISHKGPHLCMRKISNRGRVKRKHYHYSQRTKLEKYEADQRMIVHISLFIEEAISQFLLNIFTIMINDWFEFIKYRFVCLFVCLLLGYRNCLHLKFYCFIFHLYCSNRNLFYAIKNFSAEMQTCSRLI